MGESRDVVVDEECGARRPRGIVIHLAGRVGARGAERGQGEERGVSAQGGTGRRGSVSRRNGPGVGARGAVDEGLLELARRWYRWPTLTPVEGPMDQRRKPRSTWSRRDFLQTSAGAAAGLGMAAVEGCTAQRDASAPAGSSPPEGTTRVGKVSTEPTPETSPSASKHTPPAAGYNILLIVSDQERYFERWPFPVPGRERLRQLGVSFDNHQICANVCSPSRSVIYTGQHIQHTGVFDNVNTPWQRSMSEQVRTLGHLMREAGYYTAYKGKFHLSVELEEANDLEAPNKLLTEVLEKYGFADYYGVGDIIGNTRGGYLHDDLITAMSLRWLRSKGRSLAQAGKPWLLAINYVLPHDVMYVDTDLPGERVQTADEPVMQVLPPPDTPHYRQRWDVPLPETRHQGFDAVGRPAAHREFQAARSVLLGTWPDEDRRWSVLQDYYFNCIRDNDRQIERVLAELEAQDLLRNTIILFTSDHGELGGAHQMHGKGSCAYREQNQVPLVVVHPEGERGQRCAALTSHLDVTPTILAMAKMPPPVRERLSAGLKGRDFSGLLTNPQAAPVDAVRNATLFNFNMLGYLDGEFLRQIKAFREAERLKKLKEGTKMARAVKPALSKRGAIRSLFDGRYRFTRYFSPLHHHTPGTLEELLSNNDVELYDLQADPSELDNLALDAHKHRELIERLNTRLNRCVADEVGVDDGSMLPLSALVDWDLSGVDV